MAINRHLGRDESFVGVTHLSPHSHLLQLAPQLESRIGRKRKEDVEICSHFSLRGQHVRNATIGNTQLQLPWTREIGQRHQNLAPADRPRFQEFPEIPGNDRSVDRAADLEVGQLPLYNLQLPLQTTDELPKFFSCAVNSPCCPRGTSPSRGLRNRSDSTAMSFFCAVCSFALDAFHSRSSSGLRSTASTWFALTCSPCSVANR